MPKRFYYDKSTPLPENSVYVGYDTEFEIWFRQFEHPIEKGKYIITNYFDDYKNDYQKFLETNNLEYILYYISENDSVFDSLEEVKAECVELYDGARSSHYPNQIKREKRIREVLVGKDLACDDKDDEPSHADILLEIAKSNP